MVLGDLMGFSESDYAYNQSRAHSADMFLVGNILGVVLEISIMGWLIDGLKSIYGGH